MPNLRPTELIVILLIIVLLFGAKKLPELAKGIGESLTVFRKAVKTDDEPAAAPAAQTAPAPAPAPAVAAQPAQAAAPAETEAPGR